MGSATTPTWAMATLPRSPTTAPPPTLMSLSELVTVLSAMPLLAPLPLPTLLPLLALLLLPTQSPSLVLSLWLVLSLLHLTALSGTASASVTVAPSLDKNPQQYLCIYQQ